jgi:hypothetical protein
MRARIVAVGVVVGLFAVTGLAQDGANNPTGTWKWTTEGKGGQKRETVLKLKADGGKLTGTITGGKDMDIKIEDGTVKDGEVRFNVTREFKDQKFTAKYAAKVTGDVMKGTVETSFGDKTSKKDFEAKRSKD